MASKSPVSSETGFIDRHRAVWNARPDLRWVYYSFFDELLSAVGGASQILEIGSGPGFLKERSSQVIATDVFPSAWTDLVCDGCAMPLRENSVEAVVMLDVLHHLPRPLEFMSEAARVLKPGGLMAMIEPWITPASYILYRFFHQEDCTLKIDISNPFGSNGKKPLDGNATIPYNLVNYYKRNGASPLQLIHVKRFLALPYLATFGFKREVPVPEVFTRTAGKLEKFLGPIGRMNSTRALLVWQKPRTL